MARMVPVVLVRGDGSEALYADGHCITQAQSIRLVTALRALDGVLYAFGTATVSDTWLSDAMDGEFPDALADIPPHAWVECNLPSPCEDCGAFHEEGSC